MLRWRLDALSAQCVRYICSVRLASCLVYSYFELLHCFYVGLRRLMGAALVRLRLAYMHGTVSYFSFHHVII